MSEPSAWPFVTWLPTGCRLDINVATNARHTEATGLHDGALKVRLAARPVDGAANEALRQWLADELSIAAGRVRLLRGQTARRKLWEIDAERSVIEAWLQRLPPA
jgi:uncharacterized protein YggU (UPF0235/DUF167 family)